ncbi:MAG: Ku protein [Myxococcota bacterium]|nr:Ku protein [Myxococcota bacterium]
MATAHKSSSRKTTKSPRKSTAAKKSSSKRSKKSDGDEEGRGEISGGAKGVPRALWTGSLGFGLLQIPVSLHTASASTDLRFHQLDERTHDPIGYKRVNKATGEEVDWDNIVRGYEVEKGEYVVISDDDLKAADVDATQMIDIVDFVDHRAVEPVWYDKPYYLSPAKRAERAYALFREALVRTGKAAVARVVIRTRQHLALVYPSGRTLVLEILRWNHELRSPRGLELPEDDVESLKISDRELDMAEELISRMSTDWEPSRYHDQYREAVLSMIEEKARSGKVTEVRTAKSERAAPTRSSELVALLKKSLESSERKEPGEPARAGSKRGRSAA